MSVSTEDLLESLRRAQARRRESGQPEQTQSAPGAATGEQANQEQETSATDLVDTWRSRNTGAVEGFTRGSNTMIAEGLGLIGDAAQLNLDVTNWGLEMMGMQPIKTDPIMDAEWWKDRMRSIGVLTDQDVDVDEMNTGAKVSFKTGETLFASLPFLAAPYLGAGQKMAAATRSAAPRMGAAEAAAAEKSVTGSALAQSGLAQQAASRGTQGIVSTAATRPGAFLAAESGSVAGSVQGGALAEGISEGRHEDAYMVGELVGGLINPAGTAFRSLGALSDSVKTAVRALSEEGRHKNAAAIIKDIVQQSGDDPKRLINKLRAAEEFPVELTSAQKTGSDAFIALERQLAKRDTRAAQQFAASREKKLDNSLTALRHMSNDWTSAAKGYGDPAVFRAAAASRRDYYEEIASRRISHAQQRAAKAAARLGDASEEARRAASEEAYKAMDGALSDLRKIESSLYDKIPKRQQAGFDATANAIQKIRTKLTPSQAIPLKNDVLSYYKKAKKGKLTSGDLLKLRAALGDEMRDAYAQKRLKDADRLSDLYDGVQDDIENLGLQEAEEARAFSHMLNEKFTRTFAGRTRDQLKTGEKAIPPEVFLERAFAGGGTRGRLNLVNLENAAKTADEAAQARPGMQNMNYGVEVDTFSGAVRNSEEAFLREVAARTTKNGEVNPDALDRFLANNDGLLSRFPELRSQISDAATAQRTFKKLNDRTDAQKKRVFQKLSFGRLLEHENPEAAMREVLDGNFPQRDFRNVARMARMDGNETVKGLKVATLDAMRNKARNRVGGIDWHRFHEQMFKGRGERGPSVAEIMQKNGVMSASEVKRWEKLARRAMDLMDQAQRPAAADIEVGEDAMFDLAVRMAGANIGGRMGTESGSSLVLAGAVSRYMRRVLEKLPQTQTYDILVEAAEDPEFMAKLMNMSTGKMPSKRDFQALYTGFLQAGLIPKSGDTGPPLIEETQEATEGLEVEDVSVNIGGRGQVPPVQ